MFLTGGKEPGSLQPGHLPFPVHQSSLQLGLPARHWGTQQGSALKRGSWSHGLLSPVPSLPGARAAPSPVWDRTAPGAWWELPSSSCFESRGQQGPAKLSPTRDAALGSLGFRACTPTASPQPFCCSASLPQAWQDEFSPGCYREIQIPILGRLLGCLILLSSCKEEESSHVALDALHSIYRFISQRESKRSRVVAWVPPHTDF